MIPHSKPSFDSSDQRALSRVLSSGQVSQGPEVERAEKALASLTRTSACAAVCSGTKAIEMALRALKIGAGDEVIVPSFCCVSVYHGIIGAGARCVPADIELTAYHLSQASVKANLTRKTKAVLLVHVFGVPQDPGPFKAMGLKIIEDCAPAIGAHFGKKPVGSLGDAAIFSFYSTKLLAAGEGGMIASRVPRVIQQVRDLRECDNKPADVARQNVKWTDLQAALFLSQLRRLKEFNSRRAAIARRYDQALRTLPVHLPVPAPGRVYWRYVIRCGKDVSSLLRGFERRGIAARRP